MYYMVLPFHICPTCALYERALIVEDGKVTGEWKIIARDRKISFIIVKSKYVYDRCPSGS